VYKQHLNKGLLSVKALWFIPFLLLEHLHQGGLWKVILRCWYTLTGCQS